MQCQSGLSGKGKAPQLSVGDIVWAKVHKKGTCWPGLIINGPDCGQESASHQKVWVYWFGDHRFTEVQRSHVFDFKSEFQRIFKKKVGKGYDSGVIEAIKECGQRSGKLKCGLSRDVFLEWAQEGFPESSQIFERPEKIRKSTGGVIPSHVRHQLQKYCRPTSTGNEKEGSDADSSGLSDSSDEEDDPHKSAVVEDIRNKKLHLSNLCLACFTISDDLEEHPFFNAFICSSCLDLLKKIIYSVGTDGNNYNCVLCLGVDPTVIYMCSQPQCFRSFCKTCIKVVFPVNVKNVKRVEDWDCFMCTPFSDEIHGFVQPLYNNWRRNMWELFYKNQLEGPALCNTPVRILFTGGNARSVRLTIERLSEVKISVSTIFISGFFEKDVTELLRLFPDELKTVPAPWDLDEIALFAYTPIDIVIGGSRELYSDDPGDKKSMNAVCVFDDFHRIVYNLRASSLISHVFWMFEFEEPICTEFYGIISRFLDFEPGRWDTPSDSSTSILVWTNVNALWSRLKGAGVPPNNCLQS